jgi:hypothetical protein
MTITRTATLMMSCAAALGSYLRISALSAYSALLASTTLPIPSSNAPDTSAMSPNNIRCLSPIQIAGNHSASLTAIISQFITLGRLLSLLTQSHDFAEPREHIPTRLWLVSIAFTALLYFISSCITSSTYILPYYSDLVRFASHSLAALRTAPEFCSIFISPCFEQFRFPQ